MLLFPDANLQFYRVGRMARRLIFDASALDFFLGRAVGIDNYAYSGRDILKIGPE